LEQDLPVTALEFRSSWLKPFEPSTLKSGTGLKVARSRSPCPGASVAMASMIF